MSGLQASPNNFWTSGDVQVTATGDKAVFTPATPVKVVRWGYVARSLLDVGAGAIFTLDYRPIAGSDSGRVNGATSGTVAAKNSAHTDTGGGAIPTSTTDSAQGTGRDHPVRTNTNSPSGAYGPLLVRPGEEVVFECTDAADTAGLNIMFWAEYEQMPYQGDRTLAEGDSNPLANMTLT